MVRFLSLAGLKDIDSELSFDGTYRVGDGDCGLLFTTGKRNLPRGVSFVAPVKGENLPKLIEFESSTVDSYGRVTLRRNVGRDELLVSLFSSLTVTGGEGGGAVVNCIRLGARDVDGCVAAAAAAWDSSARCLARSFIAVIL